MADKTFERVIISPRERPLSSDVNLASSVLDRALRDFLLLAGESRVAYNDPTGLPTNSFVAQSFQASAGAGLSVNLHLGMGFQYNGTDVPADIDGILGLDDKSYYKPLYLSADQNLIVPTADPTNPRYDIIEVKCDRRRENALTRDVFNPTSEVYDPTLVLKSLAFDLYGRNGVNDTTAGINYKTGTPGVSPSAPSVDSGYVKIAEIHVPAAATSLTAANIIDYRRTYHQYGAMRGSVSYTGPVNAALAAPAVTGANLPPGWKIAVSQHVDTTVIGGGVRTFRIWIIPSAQPGSLQAVSSTASFDADDRYIPTTTNYVQLLTANSGHQTILAGSDAAEPISNAITVAIGQPFIRITMTPMVFNGSAIAQAAWSSGIFHTLFDALV